MNVSDPPHDEATSASGQPILRHGSPSEWRPAGGSSHTEAITAHIERQLGPIAGVFHEILSDTVHIDLHIVAPTDAWPTFRLVTSGMSDQPMAVPDDSEAPNYLELMLSLPAGWKTDRDAMNNETWYWPFRLLKVMARLPHKYATWLGFGHTVPNGDPPQPYTADIGFSGAILLPSVTVPPAFHELPVDSDKTIHFLSVLPLYREEMDLKLEKGVNALLDAFGKHRIIDVVEPGRVNTAKKKRFGLF